MIFHCYELVLLPVVSLSFIALVLQNNSGGRYCFMNSSLSVLPLSFITYYRLTDATPDHSRMKKKHFCFS